MHARQRLSVLAVPAEHTSAASQRRTLGTRHIMRWSCVVEAVVLCGAIATAPWATADPIADLSHSVASARGGACPALRYQPAVEQAAKRINDSKDGYYLHRQRTQPIDDPMPTLKEAGYNASKAITLHGFATDEIDAIRGTLVQGHAAIPDCSYTDFGVSVVQNDDPVYTMTAVVLAAPMQ